MRTQKSSLAQIVAVCAVIGCGVFGLIALLEVGKVQDLQQKLNEDERELEVARMFPTWKHLVSSQENLRREHPERYKQTQEMLRQMPAKRNESRERSFQTKLSNIQERAKLPVSALEAATLVEVTNALTEVHELELNRGDSLTFQPENTAVVFAGMQARKALDQLRDRYIEIRLQELAEAMGRHDPAELKKFVADARQVFTDADTLIGPRMFAPTLPAKPKTGSP